MVQKIAETGNAEDEVIYVCINGGGVLYCITLHHVITGAQVNKVKSKEGCQFECIYVY